MRTALCSVGVLLSAAACGADPAAGPPGVTRTTRGDTAVVTTRGPGAWGPRRDAVEVARFGEDSPETTFGVVHLLVATPDGGVILLDSKADQGMVLRQFDSAGRYVRSIGSPGGGPGEYGSVGQVTFTVARDGGVIVRDGRAKVIRYGADGSVLGEFSHGYASTLEVYAEASGNILLRGPFASGPGASPYELPPIIRHAPDGRIVDSVTAPASWRTAPPRTSYDVMRYWLPLADGGLVLLRSDRVGFVRVGPGGTAAPVRGETFLAPVEYLSEERAELTALAAWQRKHYPPELAKGIAEPPRAKLPVKNTIFTDMDDRVWMSVATGAVPGSPRVVGSVQGQTFSLTYQEPLVFAVFALDGGFLGEVAFPAGVLLPAVVGNTAWAMVHDGDGTPFLAKFRIHD